MYNIMLYVFIILDNSFNSNWYNFYYYIINVTNYIEEYKHFDVTIFLVFD